MTAVPVQDHYAKDVPESKTQAASYELRQIFGNVERMVTALRFGNQVSVPTTTRPNHHQQSGRDCCLGIFELRFLVRPLHWNFESVQTTMRRWLEADFDTKP
jgi:hypothetical protein